MKSLYEFAEQGEVISPQLVYYPELIRENISRMKRIAGETERLWPHIKTHKMAQVTKMLVAEGIDKFKCATIAELEMAAEAGGEQLVMAYPLVGPNIGRFIAVSKAYPHVMFYAIADDTRQVELLGNAAEKEGLRISLLMDVDLGQHRTGVSVDEVETLYHIWAKRTGIRMCGMHCYDGHRHEKDVEVRQEEVKKADDRLQFIIASLKDNGFDVSVVILGGTPSFPCHAKLMKEYLSPGTCVIQDVGYREAYPDLDFIPAAAVLTRVVSRPTKDTFTLDMGTKAVSCDPPVPRAEIVGMEYAETVMQNEEHWVVRVPEKHIKDIPKIGTELFALPVHICPTSALYPGVPVIERGHLKEWWEITARNRKITF